MTLLLMAVSAIHHRCFRTSLPILCAMTRHLFSYILHTPLSSPARHRAASCNAKNKNNINDK